MFVSPLKFLRAGPPPPRVVLLSDALFFTRSIPVPVAAAPGKGGPPAEVTAQVELALEAISPFPLSQLYHGFFWVPGSGKALVFAAYRRRFTADQVAAWEGAELVLPAFAAVLGGPVAPATTVVLTAPDGLTAVHWETGPVPDRVAYQALAPEAPDEDREQARTSLLRFMGGAKTVVDLSAPPQAEAGRSDREKIFRSGDFVSRLPAAAAAGLDVRDRDDLATLRRAQRRDIMIWRVGIGCVFAFAAMALGEVALVGGGMWQRTRLKVIRRQTPVVDSIITAQSLATKIQDLSTNRLLPLEMISMVNPRKAGTTIQFLTASVDNLNILTVKAQTSNPGEISSYRNTLAALPACQNVEIRETLMQNNIASFTLVVTFKRGALKPAS